MKATWLDISGKTAGKRGPPPAMSSYKSEILILLDEPEISRLLFSNGSVLPLTAGLWQVTF